LVIVKVDPSGVIDFVNHITASTDLVADVTGYFAPTNPNGYVALPPVRDLDTRIGNGPRLGRLTPALPFTLQASDVYAVPYTAQAVQLNVAVTESNAAGYLTIWPTGSSEPTTSNLNFVTGQTIANAVIVRIGLETLVSMRSAPTASTHAVSDVQGYFAPRPA
jgi:hypothetical protein